MLVAPMSMSPIHDPLEQPMPDPFLVSAKNPVGTPIRVTTMNVATSVVLLKQAPS